MNCVILGGGGFLGSHLCDELVKSGYSVTVFERDNSRIINLRHIIHKINWIEGDFTNPGDVEKTLLNADVVFHLVSTTLPKTSNENPVYDMETNVVSTLHMLELARKAKVKKIIFFSSGGTVYGIPKKIPIKESHSNEPICSYGIHKLTIDFFTNDENL